MMISLNYFEISGGFFGHWLLLLYEGFGYFVVFLCLDMVMDSN